MLTFSSSNPETLELFRSVYYRPKIVLIILLFITFPSIDRNLHQPIQSESKLSSKSSYPLHHHQLTPSKSSSQKLSLSESSTTPSNHHHQKIHSTNQDRLHPLSCPDAYLDHRNNIICPHAPKRLKSVRQRCDEVLQEIKTSIKRWSNPQLIHQSSSHLNPQLIRLVTQTSTNALTKSQDPNWKFRSIICTPISSPFAHLIILLHTLFFIQALSLLIEDALIKDACSSTFIHSFRSSSSWSKLWSRVKFRFRNQWSKRSFWEPFVFWIFSIMIISTIAIEAFGETGSWQTGAIWHDLPFRRICQTLNPMEPDQNHKDSMSGSTSTSGSKMTEVRISIIGLQALKILSFFLDRAPFLKPARSLILIECGVALVCLCQPAQHFLPQKVLPKSIKVPHRILSRITNRPARSLIEFNPSSENDRFFNDRHRSSAIETLRNRSNSNHTNFIHRQSPVIVEVETKWVLSVLVEACVCIAAISSYAVVMVHLPYTSYYWFPLILTFTYVKVCVERLKNLYRSALHTIRCLESVLSRFSPEINKRGRDWRCSICFEDEEGSDESDDSSRSPVLEEINRSPTKSTHAGNGNQRGEKCVNLKCGHLYHAKCLVKWLHYQTFCPICHRSVHTTPDRTNTSDDALNADDFIVHED
ncbi:hypothetical protein DFH28DRAFT_154027 [Melampsora americana]|nr:hypothetical protein DFH28DRAFT_154027 [Melampsora americana]